MKRKELEIFSGRVNGKGIIKRFGLKNAEKGKILTVLVVDVEIWDEKQKVIVDHAWFCINKKICNQKIQEGSSIEFTCKVEAYFKAPNFTEVQGYGIRTIRNLEMKKEGKGIDLFSFREEVINKGKELVDHLKIV